MPSKFIKTNISRLLTTNPTSKNIYSIYNFNNFTLLKSYSYTKFNSYGTFRKYLPRNKYSPNYRQERLIKDFIKSHFGDRYEEPYFTKVTPNSPVFAMYELKYPFSKHMRNLLWFLNYMSFPSLLTKKKLGISTLVMKSSPIIHNIEKSIKMPQYLLHTSLENPNVSSLNFYTKKTSLYDDFLSLSLSDKHIVIGLLSETLYSENNFNKFNSLFKFTNVTLNKTSPEIIKLLKKFDLTIENHILELQKAVNLPKKNNAIYLKKQKIFAPFYINLKSIIIPNFKNLETNKNFVDNLQNHLKNKNKNIKNNLYMLKKTSFSKILLNNQNSYLNIKNTIVDKLNVFLLMSEISNSNNQQINNFAKYYIWSKSSHSKDLTKKINNLLKNLTIETIHSIKDYKKKAHISFQLLNLSYNKLNTYKNKKSVFKIVTNYLKLFRLGKKKRFSPANGLLIKTLKLKKDLYKQLIFLKYFLSRPSSYFYRYTQDNLFNDFNILATSTMNNYFMHSKNQLLNFYAKNIFYPFASEEFDDIDFINKKLRIYNIPQRFSILSKLVHDNLLKNTNYEFLPFRLFNFKINSKSIKFLQLGDLNVEQSNFSRMIKTKIQTNRDLLWAKDFKSTKLALKKYKALQFIKNILTKNVFNRKDSFRLLHIFRTIFLKYFFNLSGFKFFNSFKTLKRNQANSVYSINFINKFLWALESTINTIIYRSKFVSSIKTSNHLVRYGFVLCNNKIVTNPYNKIKIFDIISLGKKNLLLRLLKFENAFIKEYSENISIPDYLEVNSRILSSIVFQHPSILHFSSSDSFVVNYHYKFLYKLMPSLACLF